MKNGTFSDRASELLAAFARDESAATAVEYGVMMGTLGLGLLTVVAISGDRIAAVFNFILRDVQAAIPEAAATSGG